MNNRNIHEQARRQYCIQVSRMLGQAITDVDPGPVQSRSMALATAAMTPQDVDRKTEPDLYFQMGFGQMTFFLQQLERLGFDLRAVATALEFGCGSARLLRLLRCLPDVKLIGTDINPLCVEWCREQIPDLSFYQNEKEPPLGFMSNDSADLIFAHSVFTHIPLSLQKAWLLELRRILAPEGAFVCTVANASLVARQLDESEQETLAQDGQIALKANHPRVSYSSHHTRQYDVFQTPERIVEVFGSVFEIRAYVSFWQDVLVLTKPSR